MKFVVIGAGTIGQLRAQSIRLNPATELVGVREATNLASGFDGFRAVEIANAVYRSTRDGQPVHLTPR